MSFRCAKHGFVHAQAQCPICAQNMAARFSFTSSGHIQYNEMAQRKPPPELAIFDKTTTDMAEEYIETPPKNPSPALAWLWIKYMRLMKLLELIGKTL